MPMQPDVLELSRLCLDLGGRSVLRSLDLVLGLRSRSVIIGPNGAGKTSLLQVLHGLIPPSAGSLQIHGSSPTGQPDFALVFQRPVLLGRTVLANVEHALRASLGLGRQEANARARRTLECQGLGALADRQARQLSGGEQQRVAIARAAALAPRCLLLDEPTAHLDPAAVMAIERQLLALSDSGTGIVLTTHDLGQARRLAQFVIFMYGGRIVESGPAPAFFAEPREDASRRFLAGAWLSG